MRFQNNVKVGIGLVLLLFLVACTGNRQQAEINYLDASAPIEGRVEDLLSKMSLQEKIGQMTLVERAKREGDRGLLDYRFFLNPAEKTAGIVITYANAAAWMAHHKIAYQWAEMTAFQPIVKMNHFDLFGPLNEEVKAFIADAESKSKLVYALYGSSTAGFAR